MGVRGSRRQHGCISNHRYSGSDTADDVAWHAGNSGGQVHEVGTKAANELGVYDMSGNWFEWVHDWLVGYPEGPLTDPDPVQLTGTRSKTRRG
jgi:formylglycine-generating enzyme required for sulfatase activity